MARGSQEGFHQQQLLSPSNKLYWDDVLVHIRTPLVCLKKIEQSSSASYSVIAQIQPELYQLQTENQIIKEQVKKSKNRFYWCIIYRDKF